MTLSPSPNPVSTPAPQIWPVAVIVIVVVLRAPADILPAALSAVAGIVALVVGGRHVAATAGTRAARS
ncbi:hypothetical protein GCM10009760_53660 [Kitasatospora kazusensis]|uniref:Uncharacterized protein n=1 Tax=Kitasatospora kazusensis TaxID=407974 RepID=A0ABP5LZG7_9ACTN